MGACAPRPRGAGLGSGEQGQIFVSNSYSCSQCFSSLLISYKAFHRKQACSVIVIIKYLKGIFFAEIKIYFFKIMLNFLLFQLLIVAL